MSFSNSHISIGLLLSGTPDTCERWREGDDGADSRLRCERLTTAFRGTLKDLHDTNNMASSFVRQ